MLIEGCLFVTRFINFAFRRLFFMGVSLLKSLLSLNFNVFLKTDCHENLVASTIWMASETAVMSKSFGVDWSRTCNSKKQLAFNSISSKKNSCHRYETKYRKEKQDYSVESKIIGPPEFLP